ncbi:MAG TPA: SCO family protein [Polyangia bacterium]|nr:SCO family protein [Polyangia bacterium]
MKPRSRLAPLALASSTLFVLLGAAEARAEKLPLAFPAGSEQPLTALQDIDVIEHLGDRVPSHLTFTDLAGKTVSLDALTAADKPVLVTLGYHRCPMLCSLVLDGLVKAIKETGLVLGRDLLAVDVSIDPAEDVALATATQKRIVDSVRAQPGGAAANGADVWPFWLSTKDGGAAAHALAESVGFKYKYDPQSKQYAHEAAAFLISPGGIIARYLYGVEYSARDFRLAVVEAGDGRVGTSFDKVMLACYKYDPVTRKYAPFVFAFMRIGAGLVFVALATLMGVLWRKEITMRNARALEQKRVA